MFLSIVLSVWNISGLLMVDFVFKHGFDQKTAKLQLTGLLFGVYVPLTWLGYKTTQGKLWSILVGLVLGIAIIAFIAGATFNVEWLVQWVSIGGVMGASAEQRAPLFTLLGLFTIIQWFGFLIALAAYRSKRRAEKWLNSTNAN
jgi:hypothetical protein